MVSTKYIHTPFIRGMGSKKLKAKFIGPHMVLAKRNTISFLIDLSNHIKIHPVINIQYLQLHCQNSFAGCKQALPLPMEATPAETLPTYEVEIILDLMQSGRHTKYLVHWKGYDNHDKTWEPECNMNANNWLEASWKEANLCSMHTLKHNKQASQVSKTLEQHSSQWMAHNTHFQHLFSINVHYYKVGNPLTI